MLAEQNKYTFEVARGANKPQIKQAVEKVFSVEVATVNIINIPGKRRMVRRHQVISPPTKKAVVTLKPGSKVEFFEGV